MDGRARTSLGPYRLDALWNWWTADDARPLGARSRAERGADRCVRNDDLDSDARAKARQRHTAAAIPAFAAVVSAVMLRRVTIAIAAIVFAFAAISLLVPHAVRPFCIAGILVSSFVEWLVVKSGAIESLARKGWWL